MLEQMDFEGTLDDVNKAIARIECLRLDHSQATDVCASNMSEIREYFESKGVDLPDAYLAALLSCGLVSDIAAKGDFGNQQGRI